MYVHADIQSFTRQMKFSWQVSVSLSPASLFPDFLCVETEIPTVTSPSLLQLGRHMHTYIPNTHNYWSTCTCVYILEQESKLTYHTLYGSH